MVSLFFKKVAEMASFMEKKLIKRVAETATFTDLQEKG